MSLTGLRSPVYCAESIDWERDYSGLSLGDLYAMSEQELASVDPLAINLIVAKGIPSLAELDIAHYQRQVNLWTDDFRRRCLPYWETFFHEAPGDFRNDIDYFRLGMVCQYLDQMLGIQYNLHQRNSQAAYYTNPRDLFLNGIIDTRQGSCGNMAALQLAFGWRMG